MHSLTFQSQSQLQSQYLKNLSIYQPSIQLNLDYQVIYFIKFIYCITKESNHPKQKAPAKNNFFFGFSLSKNPSCLSDISPKSIPVPETFSLGREDFLAWAKYISLGRN